MSARASRSAAVAIAATVLGLYLAGAALSFHAGMPARPVYDGVTPPASYRWVNPPANQAQGNVKPEKATGRIGLDAKKGVANGTVATADGQFVVTIQAGSIPAKSGQNSVKVDVTPLDPATLGAAPKGLSYDGNAYRVTAVYLPSNETADVRATECPADAQPKTCSTIVMRYAFGATKMFLRQGSSWSEVEGAQPVPSSLQIFADAPSLGTFVAAGPFANNPAGSSAKTYVIVLVSTIVIAAAAGFARRASIRRWWKKRGRAKGKTAKPKGGKR